MAKLPKRSPKKPAAKPEGQASPDISDLSKPAKVRPTDWPPAARPKGLGACCRPDTSAVQVARTLGSAVTATAALARAVAPNVLAEDVPKSSCTVKATSLRILTLITSSLDGPSEGNSSRASSVSARTA